MARRLNRQPLYPLPVYNGPKGNDRVDVGEIEQLRADETVHDRVATMEQQMSRRLSHLYGRNIFCSAGVPFGTFALELPGDKVGVGSRLPPASLLRRAAFIQMKVAPDVARALLERDEAAA